MTVTLLGERLRAQAQAQAKNAALARLVEFGTSTNLPESANTERQTLKDFYEAVLPAQGCYCLTLLPAGQHLWADNLDELVEMTEHHQGRTGVYFGTAAFQSVANRKQANVLALKSLRLDIDAGEKKYARDPQGTYPTQRDAVVALVAFTKAATLPFSFLVSSGEGLHVYYCLDTALAPEAWLPLAKGLGQLAASNGLRVDTSVTTDSARILRPLGGLHDNGKRVALLKQTGQVYTEASLRTLLGSVPALPAAAPASKYNLAINDDVVTEHPKDNHNRDAGLIAKHCPLLGDFSTGVNLSEPDWRRGLGILKFCLDGERLWHEWSAKDPRYDRAEAQAKWDGWDAGPTRCGAAPQCGQCKHNGKLSSPVQLGDVFNDAPLKANPDNVQALLEAVTAGGLQFVMDPDGQLNCVVTTLTDAGGVRTVLNANSVAAEDAILAVASTAGKPPSDRAIENFKARERHAARQRGEAVAVCLRVAQIDEVIYVDLGPGRVARIAGTGVQLVDDVADGVPLFRRGMGVGQLPNPELFDTCESALRFAMGTFKAQFGLTADQALITVAILLEWHRSRTPHPIFEAVGPAGSGKSTLADFVLSLIDPAGDGGRVTIGTGGPDIAAAAQQRYVLPLDNAGKMDKATSDMLCIVSTGGTLLVRLLYSNGETANLKLHRPVLITAVSPVCVAPDLQSRVVRIELPARQGDYKAEGELRQGLDTLRPRMLGALYTLLSGAMQELPGVRARDGWGHRQVDFDHMGEAMIAAAGAKPGTFLAAIGQMRERMARRTASGDLFLMALCAVLRKVAVKPTHTGQLSLNAVLKLNPQMSVLAYGDNRIEVTARPGALHKLLPLSHGGFGRDSAIPATERGLADAVRRVQPLLHGIGIDVLELASGSRPLLRFDFAAGVVHED